MGEVHGGKRRTCRVHGRCSDDHDYGSCCHNRHPLPAQVTPPGPAVPGMRIASAPTLVMLLAAVRLGCAACGQAFALPGGAGCLRL